MNEKITKKIILFSTIFFILFLADLMLKYFFFDKNNIEIQHNFKIIGIRSNAHYGTTIFDFLGINISNAWSIVLFVVLAILFLTILFFVKSTWVIVGLSILIAGIFGNGLDNVFKGFVRNVIFTPFRDAGTFNLADVLIVIGAPFTGFSLIISSFKKTD